MRDPDVLNKILNRLVTREREIRAELSYLVAKETWCYIGYEELMGAVANLIFCEDPKDPGGSWTDFIWGKPKSQSDNLQGEGDGALVINWGDYQGYMVWIIPNKGYQPSSFFVTKVGYGSCSGCDWLQDVCYTYTGTNLVNELMKIVDSIVRAGVIL